MRWIRGEPGETVLVQEVVEERVCVWDEGSLPSKLTECDEELDKN